jgi:hypothetical protein
MNTDRPSAVPGAGRPAPRQQRPADHAVDRQERRAEQAVLWIDVIGALILAAGASAFFYDMREVYLHANLRWGQDDPGARQVLVGYALGIGLWFLPAALLCGLASLGMWRSWHRRWLIQATAGTWMLVVPLVVYALQGPAMDWAVSGCPSHCWIQAFSPK